MLTRVVDDVPAGLDLLPMAASEFSRMSEIERMLFVKKSERVWVLSDEEGELMVVGVYAPTFLNVPELWMLLCRNFRRRLKSNIKELQERLSELLEIYPRISVRVDAQTPDGQNFVEIMGFSPVSTEVSNGREYIIYEVNRGVRSS